MDKSKKFRYLYESFRESRGNICIYIYTYFSIPFDSYVNTFISLIPLIPFSLYINVGERVTHTDANHLSASIKYNEGVSSFRFWFSSVSWKVTQPSLNPESKDASEDFDKGTILVKKKKKEEKFQSRRFYLPATRSRFPVTGCRNVTQRLIKRD